MKSDDEFSQNMGSTMTLGVVGDYGENIPHSLRTILHNTQSKRLVKEAQVAYGRFSISHDVVPADLAFTH